MHPLELSKAIEYPVTVLQECMNQLKLHKNLHSCTVPSTHKGTKYPIQQKQGCYLKVGG